MRRSSPILLLLLALSLPFVARLGGACKPESEPEWPYGPPPGGLPDVGEGPRVISVDAGETGADVVSPPSVEDVSASGPEVGTSDTVADATEDAAPSGDASAGMVALSEETKVALRRPVAAADREVAERETETGRKLHARLQLREALGHYRLALQRMPAHPRANYLAARALALLGRPEESLRHLLSLEFVDTETARSLLEKARGEPDFRPLWQAPTYRRLTGFGTIGVAVVSAGDAPRNTAIDRTRAALVERLDTAGLPAEPATSDGLDDVAVASSDEGPAGVVLYEPDHEALAQAVSRALDDVPIRGAGDVPAGQDVLVVWRVGESLPESPAVPLDALLDHRLQARDGYGLRLFRLRSTGWFESEDRAADGTEVRRRRGRYRVEGGTLVLTFEETLERYPEGADVPEIETKKATRTVPFEVGPGRKLVIDGLAYEPK